MLLPTRHRDDSVNVSHSSKSVASTFATITLDRMNFLGTHFDIRNCSTRRLFHPEDYHYKLLCVLLELDN